MGIPGTYPRLGKQDLEIKRWAHQGHSKVGQTGFIKIRGGHVRDIPRLGQTGFINIRGGLLRDIPSLGKQGL